MKKEITHQSRFSRVGLCYFAMMLLTQALQMGGMMLLGDLVETTTWGFWVLSYVPLYGIAVPVFLLMMKKLVPDAPGKSGTQTLSVGGWVRWVVISLGATYILNIVSTLITLLLAQLKGGAVENPLAIAQENSSTLMMLLFAGMIAPVGEEYLFRKVLWDKLGCGGEKLYILLGGFIFAMFHANLSQLLYAFVLGAAFCYIYARTGKLRYTVALHVTINIIGSVVMPVLAQSESEAVVGLVGLFLIVVIIAGIILAVRGRWKFPPELPQEGRAAGMPYADAGPQMSWEETSMQETPAQGAFGQASPEQETLPQDIPAQPAPTFGRALLAPGMIAYTGLCIALILIVTFVG